MLLHRRRGNGADPFGGESLLHDVCEDCGIGINELPVNETVRHGVELMTFTIMAGETKEIATNRYYNLMIQSREATLAYIIASLHHAVSVSAILDPHDRIMALLEKHRKASLHSKNGKPGSEAHKAGFRILRLIKNRKEK